MKLLIRPEKAADKAAVYALHAAAFEQENESRLVDLLRESEHYIPELSLVAELNGDIVGHILFTKLKIAADNGQVFGSLALAPMAALPVLQYSGIGSQLMHDGLKAAKELGYGSVIVLGHAQYYPKFGFAPASRWGITTAYEVPDENFMALELQPGALEGVSGRVIYPAGFDQV
ncbi:N-acetyltransferase [Chitinophaga lutea]|uniref:N-acetyltransferase n=1 Tax=Chitinophaga lutea TaxID=2488634 RepID=A0A3N4PIG9_9BACT|nr:N-acetyltransferase [Chitinophaga lutea]RPE08473.1 N-acetyltransferase [Chitinophaga lutea]